MATLFDVLVDRIETLRSNAGGAQEAPVAVLWPDRSGEWGKVMPLIASKMDVLTLGEYSADNRQGPAIWVRCMLARTLEEDRILTGVAPIVYLPGWGRDDLRAVEECPDELKPLAELYTSTRAVTFGHQNGRDWTPAGWLSNKERGANLSIAGDTGTQEALDVALGILMEQPVDSLQGRQLRASDLLGLLTPDLYADLLRWMSDEESFRSAKSADAWDAFCRSVKREFRIDPLADGVASAAEQLAERTGEWENLWNRFAETPSLYPGVEVALRQAMPSLVPVHPDSWPQVNEGLEDDLRKALVALKGRAFVEGDAAIAGLEAEHACRRDWVWPTPLADSLGHLSQLAGATQSALGGADLGDFLDRYAATGWTADNEYLLAIDSVSKASDVDAVRSAAATVYMPWLDGSARRMQDLLAGHTPVATPLAYDAGTCLLFVDGLRFDLGVRLSGALGSRSIDATLTHSLAALPSTTATAKPAVMPLSEELGGGDGFDPKVLASGQTFGSQLARRLLRETGWQWLDDGESGDPTGRAWTETGDIDRLGHKVSTKLVDSIERELELVTQRIEDLLDAGWKQVVVVTDHGWLLLPTVPSKVELSKDAAEPRMPRCARLKPGADSAGIPTVPWHWDPLATVAYPPGVSVFIAGGTYHHGGISPQECVTPRIVCTRSAQRGPRSSVTIASFRWAGLRLRAVLTGDTQGCSADLRRRAADSSTSITTGASAVDETGNVAVLLSDDSLVGEAAVFVVLDADGAVVAQAGVVLGGE